MNVNFHLETLGFAENAKKIIADYEIDRYAYIGRGSTAILFGDAERVFRLSSDASSHCLIAIANSIGGLCVPRMYKDYGAVGISDAYPDFDHYWLGEWERMDSLESNAELHSEFSSWLDRILADIGDGHLVYSTSHQQLIDSLMACSSDHKFYAIAQTLIALTEICNGEMDLDVSNFMLRSSTGEVVVVDPSHGMSVDPEAWNRLLM